MDPAPITAEELPEFLRAVESAFHADMPPEDMALLLRVTEPERSLAVRDRGRIVAGAGIYSRRMTVPGGDVPVAAVTQVGVLPTHRRRGLLTRLMSRQLADVHEAGREAIAALWASEAVIYGRFGYGLAARHAALRCRRARPGSGPIPTSRSSCASLRAPSRRCARSTTPPAPGARACSIGPGPGGTPHPRPRARPRGRRAAARGRRGRRWATRSTPSRPSSRTARPAGTTIVRELVALTPEAGAAVWGYVLGLDLVRTLNYHLAPSDDPLPHMLTNAQAARRPARRGALGAHRRPSAGAGGAHVRATRSRWCSTSPTRSAPGTPAAGHCAGTGARRPASAARHPPGWMLTAVELGAVHLGGTTLHELALAGRVRELRPGALAPVSRAFRGDAAPWCPEVF